MEAILRVSRGFYFSVRKKFMHVASRSQSKNQVLTGLHGLLILLHADNLFLRKEV